MSILGRIYPEFNAGGFTRFDGTFQFYNRVNALLREDMVILDFGAGRGQGAELSRALNQVSNLKGKVKKVIGLDVDPIVLENSRVDEAIVYDGVNIPLQDSSIDLIVSDFTFEHLDRPGAAMTEFGRILKPGGWICAQTPYLYSALVAASSLIPNRFHAFSVSSAQPGGRSATDVFPTKYKLNSKRALKRHFPTGLWSDYSYTWTPEPSYHFGKAGIVRLWMVYQYLKRPIAGEFLLIFIKKN